MLCSLRKQVLIRKLREILNKFIKLLICFIFEGIVVIPFHIALDFLDLVEATNNKNVKKDRKYLKDFALKLIKKVVLVSFKNFIKYIYM